MNTEKTAIQNSWKSENLTMREIEKIARALPDPYSVFIFETSPRSGCWSAEISFIGKETRRYGVETGRGEVKVWKTLFGVLDFVIEFCPAAVEVKFTFRDCDFIYSKPVSGSA